MDNSSQKYTIKEVSKKLKIPVGQLREWEDVFSSVIYVQRTKTGARLYTDHDLEVLKKVKLLKDSNISKEDVHFILANHNEVEDLQEETEEVQVKEEFIDMLRSLQNETTETIEQLTTSFERFKEELVKDLKDQLKSEMNEGQSKTKSLIQSYSHMIVDTQESTKEEIERLRQDIYKEEEEKLFIQQKLEEREEQFQEFVYAYRETAAAKEKQRFPNWLKIFKTKKESSVDLT
ncbi:helix-turn-helix domain-containing protein [Halalkalibacter krulwichiae]|uniref:HTH merR-type domain-containing protein n=1 Tax=Halalkalibacter krulwichiae TaxID=199441 RepID=A0A1X9M8K9_9BACI|nr:helix-turn-helix domain-containing protein [Halalkalibacter krulwichiae]ARK29736.1 hypothetical protein BkAM31D_07600 [Halalkalibacter krulwichiae]